MWTLSSLQLHKHPMLVVDDDATLELQVKTVKYFKSIESVAKECGFEQSLSSEVPKATVKKSSATNGKPDDTNGLKPQADSSKRPVTPDIVLDKMSSRLNGQPVIGNSEPGELNMQNMYSRMPVKAF
jgi:glucosamine-6-phosphate deaminase